MKKPLLLYAVVLLSGLIQAQVPVKKSVEKQKSHFVGEKWGGGIVIFVNSGGYHGLIAEERDLKGGTWSWYAAQEIMQLGCVHGSEGAKYTGWRLPTKDELYTLYLLRDFIGGFSTAFYWSSTGYNENEAWHHNFVLGNQGCNFKTNAMNIRAVRDF